MGVSAQQLKDALLLTKDCLSIRSESDLEEALKYLGRITNCESILVLNFDSHLQKPQLNTNAAFHLRTRQHKCDHHDIVHSPLFRIAQVALHNHASNNALCRPPCGGLGAFMAEKDSTTNTNTTLLLVSKDETNIASSQEICQFVLPHFISAIQRYNSTQSFPPLENEPSLSQREIDVLTWVSQGKSNWEAAKILGISENTVKFHVSNICKKLDVTRRGQAVAKAIQLGIISFSR